MLVLANLMYTKLCPYTLRNKSVAWDQLSDLHTAKATADILIAPPHTVCILMLKKQISCLLESVQNLL